MARVRLGVIARLPEPLGIHVQAWRRALGDPAAGRILPHLTLVPPQTVAERDLERAAALVERAAAGAVPFVVELDGAATFLPDAPVAYLAVREGGPALHDLEVALQESPLDRRTHPFHPHVTVLQDRPDERIEAAAAELAGFRAAFPVRELALMREEPDKVWRPLATATVGASTAVREVPFAEAASGAVLLLDPDPPRVLLGRRTRAPGTGSAASPTRARRCSRPWPARPPRRPGWSRSTCQPSAASTTATGPTPGSWSPPGRASRATSSRPSTASSTGCRCTRPATAP